MSESTKQLVDAMVNSNALETEKYFATAIGEKLSGMLDNMRIDVAKGMFKAESEPELSADELETSVDSSEEQV